MSFKYLSLGLASVSAFKTIKITENGQPKTLYAVGAGWEPTAEGDKITLHHNSGSFLATQNELGPMDYYTPNLRGGYLEYTVDLSQAKCGCNNAFYLVKMPGKNRDGTLRPDQDHDYYCDANKVKGDYCPEFDIMEANKYAF